MLLLRVMTYVVFYKLFFELVLCDLYLTRFDLTKDLLFDTLFIDFFHK